MLSNTTQTKTYLCRISFSHRIRLILQPLQPVGHFEKNKEKVSEELADITYYILRIADLMNIDFEDAIWKKMKKNAEKYPVEKAKGNAKKYTEL